MDQREMSYGGSGSSWIRRVVVAADGSAASNQGLEQAGDLARRLGAKVVVVFVRHVPATAALGNGVAQISVQESLDAQEAEGRPPVLRVVGSPGGGWEFGVAQRAPVPR